MTDRLPETVVTSVKYRCLDCETITKKRTVVCQKVIAVSWGEKIYCNGLVAPMPEQRTPKEKLGQRHRVTDDRLSEEINKGMRKLPNPMWVGFIWRRHVMELANYDICKDFGRDYDQQSVRKWFFKTFNDIYWWFDGYLVHAGWF